MIQDPHTALDTIVPVKNENVPGGSVNIQRVAAIRSKFVPLNRAIPQVYAPAKPLHVLEQCVVFGSINLAIDKQARSSRSIRGQNHDLRIRRGSDD
jgi:hypothetical protein